MEQSKYHILGLMSGSSLDGIDLAHCTFWNQNGQLKWQLNTATTLPFSNEWKLKLRQLPDASAKDLFSAHAAFGRYLGKQINSFLTNSQLDCDFIASHGHTIHHYPENQFTFQLGDGAAIAATTNISTIDRFRAMDMANDGQGAPVAPIVELKLFTGYDYYLNIGGIANISAYINDDRIIAFDIGGANQILDTLAQMNGLPYDDKGAMAKSGSLIKSLYEQINRLAYFGQNYPKSLGNDWVFDHQTKVYRDANGSIEDKLHTACIQLAHQIAKAIQQIQIQEEQKQPTYKLLVTGGGAWNDFLIQQISLACEKLCKLEIVIPDEDIIGFKEAILMALMGYLRVTGQANCLATATGAKRNSIGGSIHIV